jgi:hypothetical protein
LDPAELVEHALPVRALLLELLLGFLGSEQPEEERPQRRVATYPALRRRLEQPPPHVSESCVRDGVRLRVACAGLGLLDEALVHEARELRVDLAVARRPGVRERLLEVLEQGVPGPRMVGEGAEKGVAQ